MMGGGFGMGWGGAIGLLLAIGLIWVIIRAGDDSGQNNGQEPRDADIGAAETSGGARGILAERYSRGELNVSVSSARAHNDAGHHLRRVLQPTSRPGAASPARMLPPGYAD